MKKKRAILINATGGREWIGGLYYCRNIVFMLLQNPRISTKYKIVIVTEEANKGLFSSFESIDKVYYYKRLHRFAKYYVKMILKKYEVVASFPCPKDELDEIAHCKLFWIPDLQYCRLPEFSNENEIVSRRDHDMQCFDNHSPIVISSEDSRRDVLKFFSPFDNPLYTVHFVSYIVPEITALTDVYEHQIIDKYGLGQKKYVYIANQFWKHKNHIVVLEAIKTLIDRKNESDLIFVFTGALKDYRNPDYIEDIKQIFELPEISKVTRLLGFVPREEQLIIMKNCEYMIQPSLFEGWGTVLEDAKVLDKTVLLSDIPVHREQQNEKCILFDPYDVDALAVLLMEESRKQHVSDISVGLKRMYREAEEYSKTFENMLNECI